MRRWWWGLSDDELLARLVQRGVRQPAAENLVRSREDEWVAQLIEEAMDR